MLSAIIAIVVLSQCPGGSCPTYNYRQPIQYVQPVQYYRLVPQQVVYVQPPPPPRPTPKAAPYNIVLTSYQEPPKIKFY